MSITFPYKRKTIEEGVIADPIIILPVETIYGIRELNFLVDTGADTTVLPIRLAADFGFKPSLAKKEFVQGVGKAKVGSYRFKIKIYLGDIEYMVRCVFVESDVIPLLGRLDVWNKFTIIFDNIKEEVVFEKI